MTLHTKAATEDMLDIFNQPLRNVDPMAGPEEDEGDTDYDDDDYTSGGESTGTGRISGTSDFGDTEPDIKATASGTETGVASVSPWSEFTASKHVPKLDATDNASTTERTDEVSAMPSEQQAFEKEDLSNRVKGNAFQLYDDSSQEKQEVGNDVDAVTPIMPEFNDENEAPRTRYIPLPPEDYEPPVRYTKDPAEIAQNRLPFMTPIVEKTESSLGAFTVRSEKDYFSSKTPSRKANEYATPLIDEEVLSSPFREIINEARPPQIPKLNIASSKLTPAPVPEARQGPIIQDAQCNPVDDSIRKTILEAIQPPLKSYTGFHDYGSSTYNKAPEIKKHINALKKTKADGKTTTLSLPPTLRFPKAPSKLYTIKRELGKGAFAPVYLAEEEDDDAHSKDNNDENNPDPSPKPLLAIKCEDPPTPWEFYIMSTLHTRLSSSSHNTPLHPSTLPSLCKPTALHLFHDEAYLLETYLDQGTLLDLVNLAKSDPAAITANQTTLDEPIAMFFTVELLRTVEAMHSAGILHGDLKADNCLVRLSPSSSWDAQYHPSGTGGWSNKGITVIDFGRSIDLHCFHPHAQFLADWKTTKQDCPEMQDARPWKWQVDYWGVAGVVHSLLWGRYLDGGVVAVEEGADRGDGGDGDAGEKTTTLGIPGPGRNNRKRYRVREGLKRYWQVGLWGGLFDVLLNPDMEIEREDEGGGGLQELRCARQLREVREGMEAWLVGEGGRKGGGLKAGLGRLEGRIGREGVGGRGRR